jgi:hypothetical protein
MPSSGEGRLHRRFDPVVRACFAIKDERFESPTDRRAGRAEGRGDFDIISKAACRGARACCKPCCVPPGRQKASENSRWPIGVYFLKHPQEPGPARQREFIYSPRFGAKPRVLENGGNPEMTGLVPEKRQKKMFARREKITREQFSCLVPSDWVRRICRERKESQFLPCVELPPHTFATQIATANMLNLQGQNVASKFKIYDEASLPEESRLLEGVPTRRGASGLSPISQTPFERETIP